MCALLIFLLIVFIDYVRNWSKKKKRKDKNKRAKKIWDKYGLPGLAFIGPFFIGTHLTALLAISFGGTRSKTLVLMTAIISFLAILLCCEEYFCFYFLVIVVFCLCFLLYSILIIIS